MKKIAWILVNIQLVLGFIYSYDYLHRHIIIQHVFLFIISVIIFSNILFYLMKKIRLYSMRAFLAIIISSFTLSIFFIIFTHDFPKFTLNSFLMIFLYLIIRLLLFITTPIMIILELFYILGKIKT